MKRAANLTCFEKVFADPDDFMAFQALFDNDAIRDHVNGGLLLKLDLSRTTLEGVVEILKRSGLDISKISFSYEDGPEEVFIPNEAFPGNIREVTVYQYLDDTTIRH